MGSVWMTLLHWLIAQGVAFKFDNIDKNLQLAFPIQINITCTGSKPCFTTPAPPAPTPPAPPPTPPAPPNPFTPTQVYVNDHRRATQCLRARVPVARTCNANMRAALLTSSQVHGGGRWLRMLPNSKPPCTPERHPPSIRRRSYERLQTRRSHQPSHRSARFERFRQDLGQRHGCRPVENPP